MLLTSRYSVSLTLLILFFLKAGLSVAQPSLLNRKVNISVRNEQASVVLQRLSKQTGAYFSYDPALLSDRKITLNASGIPLQEVLQRIFDNPSVGFREIGNQLVVYRERKKETEPITTEKKETPESLATLPKVNDKILPPDTVFVPHTDTIFKFRIDTLTLVQTDTIIRRDTILHTDTIYLSRTRKAGKTEPPDFSKNSVSSQQFREDNGWYAAIAYEQLIGKPLLSEQGQGSASLLESMKKANGNSPVNFSIGAVAGYDYYRLGVLTGISFTRLGETFEYSYTQQVGGFYITDTVESYYTVGGIDTTWYYVTDSSWVNIDYKNFTYKNPNSYRYLELPLMVKFRIIQGSGIDLYALGGIVAGIAIGRNALLISPEESNTVEWVSSEGISPLILSWKAGAGIAISIGSKSGIFLEGTYRQQFNSQLKNYPLNKKFNLLNLKTGIFVRL